MAAPAPGPSGHTREEEGTWRESYKITYKQSLRGSERSLDGPSWATACTLGRWDRGN